ncbi:arylsulfate sulfotransferase [Muriicola jejuensis]|uniref:Aryl-sulfate sulfotransferase n=1 Tax=Muriicola jejuensis TaxID=504488 RepID=A0A6P0U7V2_9FLAO|nr:aryl-sulfate sulfotransferase [Muriicola jejuensis]NER09215.1 aryl-sulfate sulfotransferase [Muriicola jejuensis]SMP10204.1 arylsulfate sulfotransferase [Muriicola jejuensis]
MTRIQSIPVACFVSLCIWLLNSCSSGFDYSIEPELNPNKIAPLTALLRIEAEQPVKATVKVLGSIPVEQEFEEVAKVLEIPVVGLYPDRENRVAVTLSYAGGEVRDTVNILTDKVPSHFPHIVVDILDRDKMAGGMHGCDLHLANRGTFSSTPLIFDDEGNIRWYLDLSFAEKMVSPFQRLSDGTLLMVSRHVIYEFDMLGKIIGETSINNNYGMHHDVVELPDGNLLIAVGKRNNFIKLDGNFVESDSDFIILYDRKNARIAREWDMANVMDVSRKDLNFFRPGDWLHMNGLAFDPRDNSIIVSGKNQGLFKISWNNELEWILAPKKNWGPSGRNGDGFETAPFLLTAVDGEGKPFPNSVQIGTESADEFDFTWGPHAPKISPDGTLLVFDNGTYRNYDSQIQYSRAVEYRIDEENKTVEQLWQYGKERGSSFFSTIVSDVDYLPETQTILVTSGYTKQGGRLAGKIVEVDRESGKEVFEATVYMKSVNGNKTPSWGQTDILYRSQRMPLKY